MVRMKRLMQKYPRMNHLVLPFVSHAGATFFVSDLPWKAFWKRLALGQYPWHQVFFLSLYSNTKGRIRQMNPNHPKIMLKKPRPKKTIVMMYR
jgi:hypothetical protein